MAGSDPMMPTSPGVKLTHDDFVQFPEDGRRHELIPGLEVPLTRVLRRELGTR